jgi:hypothetical protein
MNMSVFSHSSLLAVVAALAVGATACASAPPPAPAAAPPSNAFQQAATPGVAEQQGDDGVVFVNNQDRKDPSTHTDDAPVTGLKADSKTGRPQH